MGMKPKPVTIILLIAVVVLGVYFLNMTMNKNMAYPNEGELQYDMQAAAPADSNTGMPTEAQMQQMSQGGPTIPENPVQEVGGVQGPGPDQGEAAPPQGGFGGDVQASVNEGFEGCSPKRQLSPQELLPKDYASTWAQCNPSGAGSLDGKNFLQAGHHIGINTIGQSLKNPNLQLRSEPPNPQVNITAW